MKPSKPSPVTVIKFDSEGNVIAQEVVAKPEIKRGPANEYEPENQVFTKRLLALNEDGEEVTAGYVNNKTMANKIKTVQKLHPGWHSFKTAPMSRMSKELFDLER